MTSSSPIATCTLTTAGNIVEVPVSARRTVRYKFDTRCTNPSLTIPYAVAIDGCVEAAYANKPRKLDASSREIKLQIEPGRKVALYLNSDAHPDFRKRPVYAITVGEHDALIKITERSGRISDADGTIGAPTCHAGPDGVLTDTYDAKLTGDVWMMISHVYTVSDADNYLPQDIDPIIREAVLRIFRGLSSATYTVELPGQGGTRKTLRLHFQESQNVMSNTSNCPLLTAILPRTHPCAFAALITEAFNANVSEIQVTSCWRPMLGSIVHRAGLGLDITFIENPSGRVRMNRVALTVPGTEHDDNVSEKERELYQDYQRAELAVKAAEANLKVRMSQLASNRDPAKRDQLRQDVNAAESEVQKRRVEEIIAKNKWASQCEHEQPSLYRSYREALHTNHNIQQILDPWYMEYDTPRSAEKSPNEQHSQIEKIHANHLHITVRAPKLL